MRPLYVRELTAKERAALQNGLRSFSAFTLRRCQILLMSADERLTPSQIAHRLRCSDQCVRDAIHAFEAQGLVDCLQVRSRARHDDQAAFGAEGLERLKEIIRLSLRTFGYETSLWTLDLLAAVCFKEGLTQWLVGPDTVSRALKQVGIAWRRAKHWIRSPDEHYAEKKSDVIG